VRGIHDDGNACVGVFWGLVFSTPFWLVIYLGVCHFLIHHCWC
jgi:hypothetical protein